MNDEVLLKYQHFLQSINGFVWERIPNRNGLVISTVSNEYSELFIFTP